ncbi:unannotated protein [freshwater metagenome]|uniref:Unannotated protein n=1 Tax=freshwater metagenome TaxID=449393 RepID=A0A6J7FJW9_9ZZZZ|nr:YggU family protein [Actinomycetota bacterium]
MTVDLITAVDGGVLLAVYVQPGAKRNAAVGLHDGALKLAVAAPPREGAANEAVVRLVAELFGVARRQVELVSGGLSRHKRIAVSSISVADAQGVLAAFFPPK